jgi:hypothetical protein
MLPTVTNFVCQNCLQKNLHVYMTCYFADAMGPRVWIALRKNLKILNVALATGTMVS